VITDYASLQTEIISESHRSDLTAKLPDFIQRAEREMARTLPLRAFETTVTGTSTGTITLPADFDQVELLVLNANGREYTMDYTSPNGVSAYVSGNPNRYTLLNGVLKFIAPTGGDYTLNYLRKLVPLSDAAPTNFLLTEHPDAYLYGALVQVAMYTRDELQIAKYAPLFNVVMSQIASQDARKRLPAAGGLQIKPRSYR
jgi:hypothetical protein